MPLLTRPTVLPALILLLAGADRPPSWPLQTKQQLGESAPADPRALPRSRAPASPTFNTVLPLDDKPRLVSAGPGEWLVQGWRMAAASRDDAGTLAWMPAVVPGTALVSLLANGSYPDPAYGLNNLRVPEDLARQDYVYRTELTLPASARGRSTSLVLDGVNYAAEARLDGVLLGQVKGAFIRGRFALPAAGADGRPHALEIRVSPPPHPGFPQEESLAAGPGNNGGRLALDGPTFIASEGWDWMPGVRDRNTGLWQDVRLVVTGPVALGDIDVRTVLPRTDNSVAEIEIEVPVDNASSTRRSATIRAAFDKVAVTKTVDLPAGRSVVRFTPGEFASLRVANPRLWWPNGYGAPALHDLQVSADTGDGPSDRRALRFGMREVSYELTVNRGEGTPERIEYRPSLAAGKRLIGVDHAELRQVPGGWAPSLVGPRPAGAIVDRPETTLAPHMVIRVNHVPIAVRGGNWGMDDWLKRSDPARLEPYFRLHRDAHLNTIRNWVGQSTQESFFALADRYGLMVLNDFWISTQDFNAEPEDVPLFLANAEDTISRYRHHPSIVLWLGRNEGVPPPALNMGLDALIRRLDGTRHYAPNSRSINMANSGPWNYQPPERYFTDLAQGFSTEIGTPSFPTLEAFEAFVPPADRWPISDTWAYHDWHQAAGGNVAPFMAAMRKRLGAPSSLADFERKAQLLEYEAHRAIFEGMNAGLFTRNSGRLLWMTQPAWPSTNWQMMSHDYDTHGAFWGVAHGAEPVHVQMAADTGAIQVVNSLPRPLGRLTLSIRSVDLDGRPLVDRRMDFAAPALTTRDVTSPTSVAASDANGAVTVLELRHGKALISRNVYWRSADAGARGTTLASMATASVDAALTRRGGVAAVTLTNRGSVPALMVKITVKNRAGRRVLPAYLSDNYVSLLPGERRVLTIACAASCPALTLGVRGWNVEPSNVANALKHHA